MPRVHKKLLEIWTAWKKPIVIVWLALTLGKYTLPFTFPATGVRGVLLLIQDALTGVVIVSLLLEEREKLKPEHLQRWVWVWRVLGWGAIAASGVSLFSTGGGPTLLRVGYLLLIVVFGALLALQ